MSGCSKLLLVFFLIFIMVCMINTPNAYAYIDPGTGSYIMQIFIAFLLSIAFSFKFIRNKIKAFFTALISIVARKK